jgi:hypothetical protein
MSWGFSVCHSIEEYMFHLFFFGIDHWACKSYGAISGNDSEAKPLLVLVENSSDES